MGEDYDRDGDADYSMMIMVAMYCAENRANSTIVGTDPHAPRAEILNARSLTH